MKLLIDIDWLRELNMITVILRLLIAGICGGLVGLERERHGRAAGLRTHMMVSTGAALTTLIGIFNVQLLDIDWADPMRIGAQVISGIGFLGAGTILLKRGNSQITGLTTAAGLWVTAIIGLSAGAGFYEGAIFTAIFAMLIFTIISRLEMHMNSKRAKLFVYLEIDGVEQVQGMIDLLGNAFEATEIQVTPPRSSTVGNVGMEALIRIPKKVSVTEKINKLQAIDHVIFAMQL